MSIKSTYAVFNQQLQLKLALGQQFKQILHLPEVLKSYADAQNILALNQAWVLMQQAGYQAQTAPDDWIQMRPVVNQQPITAQEKISPELIQVLQLILKKLDPKNLYEEKIYISKIIRMIQQQNKIIPRYLLLDLFKLKNYDLDDEVFAEILPKTFYQCDKTSFRVGRIKILKKYNENNQDAQILIDYIGKLYKDERNKFLHILKEVIPDFYQQYIGEILLSISIKEHKSFEYKTCFANLKQGRSLYESFAYNQAEKQDVNLLVKKGLMPLYLYYTDNFFYPKVEEQILKYMSYDVENKIIQFDLCIEQLNIFEQYCLDQHISDEIKTELRKILKRKVQEKLTEDDLQHLNAVDGYKNIYFGKFFEYIPLSLWERVLGDFKLILILDRKKYYYMFNAFVQRCKLEDRIDLLQWFYREEPLWCEASKENILKLFTDHETEKFIVSRLVAHVETKVDAVVFYKILKQKQHLLSDLKITELAQAMLDDMILSKKDYKESLLELMMLEGYPIDFTCYQSLLSPYKWQVLSMIVEEKSHCLNKTV